MTECNNCMKTYEFFGEDAEDSAEFVVNTEVLANWCIKKIKEEQAEHDRLVALAKAEIEEINNKIVLLDKRLEINTGFLKGKLYEYFNTVKHKATKTQETYKLLDGDLVWKKPSQKMVPDKDKLLAYVKEHNMPEFVKVKEDVDWASYKKECEISNGKVVNFETGELLPEDLILVEDVPGEFTIK